MFKYTYEDNYMSQHNYAIYYMLQKTGVLVNLEGTSLSSSKGELLVPIVTSVAEVLSRNVTELLSATNGILNGGSETEASEDRQVTKSKAD